MQMSLFENNIEKLNLYKAVDDIKERFGSKLVTKAVTSDMKDSENAFTTRHNKKKSSN
jgi:DNA polymerase-4